jgi:hypothetical protein
MQPQGALEMSTRPSCVTYRYHDTQERAKARPDDTYETVEDRDSTTR